MVFDWISTVAADLLAGECVEAGCEGEEGDVPVDGDLVGGITGLLVEVALVSRYILRVTDPIGECVLLHRVRSTGEEAGQGALGMAERQAVVRMSGRTCAEACDIAVARSVLAQDIVEAALGVDAVALVAREPISGATHQNSDKLHVYAYEYV